MSTASRRPAAITPTRSATGAAFVMAASVARAFRDDPMWFAVPYVVVRVLGLILCALAIQFILLGLGEAIPGMISGAVTTPYPATK